GAEALTVGDTGIILMRQSTKFAQGSAAYTALLAHELTHVAQARPDVIARKETAASQADVSASEKEAELNERKTMADEMGRPDLAPGDDEKGDAKKEKKKELLALVLELLDNESWVSELRTGSRAQSLI